MNRFRELRLKSGYKTQQQLANVLFVNQTAVSQWERGATMPSAPILRRLSQMYNVSIDYMLGESDEPSGVKKEPALPMESELDMELVTRLCRLTPEELEKVDAFVQGILAAR